MRLGQFYARVGKIALVRHQRYAHAKQFKHANKALRRLRTMLGRVVRDIGRKIGGRPELAEVFALPLALARRVRDQDCGEWAPLLMPSVQRRPYAFRHIAG